PIVFALDGHEAAVTGLEMQVVGGRGAALGAVVEDGVARTHRLGELEQVRETFADALGTVGAVGDGEMLGENREGIAEDEVIVPERDASLLARSILCAEKAFSLADRFSIRV